MSGMNTSNKALNPLWDFDQAVYAIGHTTNDEPLNYALATVREHINNILDLFPDRQWHRIFISGEGNFRDKVATIKPYKGNRDKALRPKHYDDIRQYVIERQGAEVVNGMEAEDACGIEQWKHKDKSTVIISVDKDVDMIPGFRYNPHPKHMDLRYINLPDANYTFWKQVLTGDSTDNIMGIKGMGPKTAEKLLANCGKSWMNMAEVVSREYSKVFGFEARAVMHETANLVWILREENKGYDGSALVT